MHAFLDIETDGLSPTRIHIAVVKIGGKHYRCFNSRTLSSVLHEATVIVGHNLLGFDLPYLYRLWSFKPNCYVLDTLLLSQYYFPDRSNRHSLRAWGTDLGIQKTEFSDWDNPGEEMYAYCEDDVDLVEELYTKKFLPVIEESDRSALDIEHYMASVCAQMTHDGFAFDLDKATEIRKQISSEVEKISSEFDKAFPPTVIQKPRSVETIKFNPASPKQVIDKLWEAGWSPVDKTDGAKKNRDKTKKERFSKYGWKLNETNLATLPDTAPDYYRNIVKYLLLISRVRRLDEWIGLYDGRTGSIHGHFNPLGTWTHRFIHSSPNMGNVSAEKSIKYKGTELAGLATSLGREMRSLWTKHDDTDWLVGTDAEGIQLRIFGHYIKDQSFIQALVSGDKSKGTDPHSLNRKLLGRGTRDTAKTFIYAYLLGAGIGKIGEILGCSRDEAIEAVDKFIRGYQGLRVLRQKTIPSDARRGYFVGLDERKVQCNSEHLMLAGYLQNGESVIMKHANRRWRKEVDLLGIFYRQVNLVHDEYQTEVRGKREEAEAVGRTQSEAIAWAGRELGCLCPLAGSYSIGVNWHETH